MSVDAGLVRRLEEATFRAWPAEEEIRLDGWLVRFASGHTGRANSVNPMGPVRGDPLAAVRRCEELFRKRRLRPLFRMTPLVQPAGLGASLDARGYVTRSRTRVLVCGLEGASGAPGAVRVATTLEDGWLDRVALWTALPASRRPALRGILARIEPPRAFATVTDGGEPVGAGLAVCEDGLVGLFDLVVEPGRRGRGHGSRLVEGLLAWGVAQGARRAYLQVEEINGGARRLYRRIGFEDLYSYEYRVSSEESPYQLPKSAAPERPPHAF